MVILKKDSARKLPVLLVDSSGKLETGVALGDVTVVTSKNGGVLTGFTLTDKWAELGQGLYTINFAAGDLDTEGFFAYLVTVAGCDQYSGMMYVSDWESNVDSILEDTATTLPASIATVDTVVDAIKGKTDALPTDPADESLLEAAITAAEGNIRGTDSDTLKTLSEQVDECQAELDTLPPDPADESSLEAAIAAAEGNIRGADSDDLKGLSDQVDGVQTQAETNGGNISTALANQAVMDGELTTIQADLDNPDQYKADVAALALEGTLLGVATTLGIDIAAALAVLQGEHVTIQADLDDPDQYKADVAALALEATMDAAAAALTAVLATAQLDLDYLKQKESGRWKIENDQLTYYEDDGVTPLRTFNLFDKDGRPTNLNPTERVPA